MNRKKNGQKYVVRCIKPIPVKSVTFYASSGNYQKGQYISPNGEPAKSLYDAQLYPFLDVNEEMSDFPFEDEIVGYSQEPFSNYFEKVPVEIIIKEI